MEKSEIKSKDFYRVKESEIHKKPKQNKYKRFSVSDFCL